MTELFIAIRSVHFASTAIVTGVTIFRFLIAEAAFRKEGADISLKIQSYRRKMICIFWISLGLTVLSGIAWLIVLAANISGQTLADVVSNDTAWILLTETQFGYAWTARLFLAALLLGSSLLRNSNNTGNLRWDWLSTFAAVCLMGSLAWWGHAGGTPGINGDIHVAADFLHLVAAGAWLGGLLPVALLFALVCKTADQFLALVVQTAVLRFSTLGLFSVGTLLATGLVNTWMLAGSLSVLLGTDYGKLLLLKIALFIVMVSIAGINRVRLTPSLPNINAVRQLLYHTVVEIGLGLIIIAIVSVLGVLPPSAHTDMQMHTRTHMLLHKAVLSGWAFKYGLSTCRFGTGEALRST